MSEVVVASQKATEKLEQWAGKFKVAVEVVQSTYMKNLFATKDEKLSLRKTMIELQKEYGSLLSNAPFFYAYVIDDSGLVDIFELMRQKSIKAYESDDNAIRDKAINVDNIVTIDGTPLDYRKTVFGKPNEYFGQPLTGHSYQRTLLGIVSTDEAFTTPFVAEISAQGDFAKEMEATPLYKFYAFRGNQNKKYPGRVRLSAGTKVKEVTEPKVTVAEVANKIKAFAFNELEMVYGEQFAGKKRTYYLAPVRGYVAAMSLQAFQGSRVFVLMDDETEEQLRCRISETIPIIFKEADDVLALVRLYASKKDGKIGAQVRAYLVVS
jgi:hypothetical protein